MIDGLKSAILFLQNETSEHLPMMSKSPFCLATRYFYYNFFFYFICFGVLVVCKTKNRFHSCNTGICRLKEKWAYGWWTLPVISSYLSTRKHNDRKKYFSFVFQ